MIHRVSRLAARPDFQAVVTAQTESGATEPRGLGLLAEWVLACQSFATAARELAPKQELVDKAQKPRRACPIASASTRRHGSRSRR